MISILVIHQPPPCVLDFIDDLCILSEGEIIFFGKRADFLGYLQRLDIVVPVFYSAIEYFLDYVNCDYGDVFRKKKDIKRFLQVWREIEEKRNLLGYCSDDSEENPFLTEEEKKFSMDLNKMIEKDNIFKTEETDVEFLQSQYNQKKKFNKINEEKEKNSNKIKNSNIQELQTKNNKIENKKKFPRSFFTQIKLLTKRNIKLSYRNPIYYIFRLIIYILLAFLLSSCFRTVENKQKNIRDKFSFIFFAAFFPGIFAAVTILPFLKERKIFKKEYSNNSYSIFAYVIARFIIVIISLFIIVFLYTLILYPLSNLKQNFYNGLIFFLAEYIFLIVVETFHFMIISYSGNINVVLPISLFVNILFAISLGFFKKLKYMPKYLYFFHYVSFEKYVYEIFIKNEFEDLFYLCDQFGDICSCYFERNNLDQCEMTGLDILKDYEYDDISILFWFGVLGFMFVFYLIFGMIFLKKAVK